MPKPAEASSDADHAAVDAVQPPPVTEVPESVSSATDQLLDSASTHTPFSAVAELADAGIQHGWLGRVFSSNAEWLLCQTHDLVGLPWVWSIPATILIVRVAFLKIQVGGMRSNLTNMLAKPRIEQHIAKIRAAQQAGRQGEMLTLQKEFKRIQEETGFSPFGPLKYPFFQGIFFASFFWAFKNMADAKLPSLVNEGALWFGDLSAPATAYGLPLIACGLTLLMVEVRLFHPSAPQSRLTDGG